MRNEKQKKRQKRQMSKQFCSIPFQCLPKNVQPLAYGYFVNDVTAFSSTSSAIVLTDSAASFAQGMTALNNSSITLEQTGVYRLTMDWTYRNHLLELSSRYVFQLTLNSIGITGATWSQFIPANPVVIVDQRSGTVIFKANAGDVLRLALLTADNINFLSLNVGGDPPFSSILVTSINQIA
jgi:hypothetical protein